MGRKHYINVHPRNKLDRKSNYLLPLSLLILGGKLSFYHLRYGKKSKITCLMQQLFLQDGVTTLRQLTEVCGHLFTVCTGPFRSHHGISIWLRSGLLMGHCNTLILLFFFNHSVVDFVLCSSSCCTIQFD